MKVVLYVTLIVFFVVTTEALVCFECANAPSNEECNAGFNGGLRTCPPNALSCENLVRTRNGETLYFKQCKQPEACRNNLKGNTNGPQCRPGDPIHSECWCCCSGEDFCNRDSLCLDVGTTMRPTPRDIEETTAPPTCSYPDSPNNGYVSCGNELGVAFLIGSTCDYGCNEGFTLSGSTITTCSRDEGGITASFNPSPPECIPEPCEPLDDIENGKISCSNGEYVGSVCEFACNDGYSLHPPHITETECLTNKTWTNENPCCVESCSPDALIDLVIVLDSSSSISTPNWEVMIQFTTNFISKLNIRPDAANIGVFRYNEVVDEESRIFLKDYANDRDGLINAVEQIPYNGVGTKTGNALRYARNVMFRTQNGDRPKASNVILVITDGRAQDDRLVVQQSQALRDDGILTYAIGIQAVNNALDIPQLNAIAGSPDQLIILERGFQELSESLAGTLGSNICEPQKCPDVGTTVRPTPRDMEETTAPPTCSDPDYPNNGYVLCGSDLDDNFIIGSTCDYGCNEGFTLSGSTITTCSRDEGGFIASFNPSPPECIPEPCEPLDDIENGKITCSKGEYVGSICEFACDEGYSLHPPHITETECLTNKTWTNENPCCVESCSPDALIDLVIVLDSSSSISTPNWEVMIQFTTTFISKLNIRPDAANIGVFRYNEVVDENSRIFLKDYANDRDGLINAVEQIPYNGVGTKTGNALRYARNVMFRAQNGDRPKASNVILVITDGRAQDGRLVVQQSQGLRDDGILTYAIGIQAVNNALDIPQLNAIAGSPDQLIILERGFQELSESLAGTLGSNICEPRKCPGGEVPPTCPAPNKPENGDVICANELLPNEGYPLGSVCEYSCFGAYTLDGPDTTTCTESVDGKREAFFEPEPPICTPPPTCAPPNQPENGEVSCLNSVPANEGYPLGSVCEYTCNEGHTLDGPETTVCRPDTEGTGEASFQPQPPICTPPPTCALPNEPVNGVVICPGIAPLNGRYSVGAQCIYYCNEGYIAEGEAGTVCRESDDGTEAFFDPEPLTCSPPPTCPPPNKPVNGAVLCDDEVSPDGRYSLESRCVYFCNDGYIREGPAGTICRESMDGTGKAFFQPEPPICTITPTCPPPSEPENGGVSCREDANFEGEYLLGSQCTYFCNQGYLLTGPERTICGNFGENAGEPIFSPKPPICSAPTCPPPNTPENGDVDCREEVSPNGGYPVGSQCIYVCNEGYAVDGPEVTTCTENFKGTGQSIFDPEPPICTPPPTCPPPNKPVNGAVLCDDEVSPDGRYSLESRCIYYCNNGYIREGPAGTICRESDDGTREAFFEPEPPICTITPTCPPPSEPENGGVSCREDANFEGEYLLGSQCTYFCDEGYLVDGPQKTICRNVGEGPEEPMFDPRPPICRAPPCVQLDDIENGEVSCPDGNKIGAICEFSCNEKYSLFPPHVTETECLSDSTWSYPNPCCLENCSPDALVDLVIVLDSSSSITRPNWNVMLQFTATFISNLNIRPDAANIGVFRYNNRIDEESRIFLNKYTNDRASLINAVGRIPYNGVGTRTGNALRYARTIMFNEANGDRPNANNTIIVITDGRAQDGPRVISESEALRKKGVLTYAVGINAVDNALDIDQLNAIAGSQDQLIILNQGFEGLGESLATALGANICAPRECPEVPR